MLLPTSPLNWSSLDISRAAAKDKQMTFDDMMDYLADRWCGVSADKNFGLWKTYSNVMEYAEHVYDNLVEATK